MMPPGRPRRWLEYKHLSRWLSVATKGLSDESKNRVHEEITTHFHDATDEGMRLGLSENIAAEQAVESLGSAPTARRAFRRTYLTRSQARTVRLLAHPPKGLLLVLAFWGALAGFAATWGARQSALEWYVQAGLVTLMAVALIALGTAVPRLYRGGRKHAAVALRAGTDILFWSPLLVLGGGDFASHRWYLLGVVVFIAAVYLPLLPKFGKERQQRA